MTDRASRTIDRHEPIIPDYIQGELSKSREKLFTKIKNQFVLRHCNVGQIKRWVKLDPTIDINSQRIITKELLDRAESLIPHARCGPNELQYLYSRGINDQDASRFSICSTKKLCSNLPGEDIANLSLQISDKFDVVDRTIDGVSIPYFYNNVFFGFCTRIMNNDDIKYSITIPHRMCFGVDLTRSDELYIVEGVFDAITMIKNGFNCMALGDSQPNYWKMLVASKFKRINLLFDNDYSGLLGACKAYIILEEMLKHNDISILLLSGKDPNGSSAWNKITLRDAAATLTELGKLI